MAEELEIWKDVVGYEGLYQVSNLGRVKSVARIIYKDFSNHPTIKSQFAKYNRGEVIMQPFIKKTGYYTVSLTKDHKKKTWMIHQLVAKAFIPNPENKEMINHIDCNTLNNRVENLEWCTNSENQIHAMKNGLKVDFGANHPNSKLTEDDVRYIREHYIPKDKEFGYVPLSKKFGVSTSTIDSVVYRKRYKDVI